MNLEKAKEVWKDLDEKWSEVHELQKEFDKGTRFEPLRLGIQVKGVGPNYE